MIFDILTFCRLEQITEVDCELQEIQNGQGAID